MFVKSAYESEFVLQADYGSFLYKSALLSELKSILPFYFLFFMCANNSSITSSP